MTHKEALIRIDGILNAGSTTWQEKKNLLADLIVNVSHRPTPHHDDDFNADEFFT